MDYSIDTFGFGNDHDENLLSHIANHKRNLFFYVKNLKLVEHCFAKCLGSLFSIMLRNVNIEVMTAQNVKMIKQFGNKWKKGP